MPELTEITNETPAKLEESEARIEDDDDDDSDTTIPELEDTGKISQLTHTHSMSQSTNRPIAHSISVSSQAIRQQI